jgi:sec-independent protein translocase protein TatA
MVAGTGRTDVGWYRAPMPFGISLPELLILLVVLLLVFGAKRLPEMGKSLGKGMREFKDAVSGMDEPTTTTPSAPAELPPVHSQPTVAPQSGGSAEESEREKVS